MSASLPQSEKFDLVVLGSGPAGEKGAAQAAYFQKRVAVVEASAEVGGASTHTGTLPSKTLRETALYLTGFRRRELYGVNLRFDRKKSVGKLVGRLKQVIDAQVRQIRRNLDRHGIDLVAGFGSFEDPHTLAVRDSAGTIVRRLSADAFLIATGSSPLPPPGIGVQDPDVVNSDHILDLDRVPSSMTVVGGGVIGTEYACLFAALGTRITLVEGRERLLGGIEEEFSATIQLSLERMGAEILLGDAVVSVERTPGRKTNALHLKLKSGRRLQADKVLFSVGRAGNTRGLGLDKAGISLTERGHIPVNEHFQTSVPHIYAAGDVVGFPGLASVSMEQGRVAACHAFQIEYKKSISALLPLGIYSIPEISYVGPTEQELLKKEIPFEIGRARFENNARGQITGDSDGMIKLLFDPISRKLLAAHILGEHATELVHIPMLVMAYGGKIDAFIDSVFNFPTLAESFKYAAYDGLQRCAQRSAVRPPAQALRVPCSPATRHWFVGVAVGGTPSPGDPISVCEMDRWRRCRFFTWSFEAPAAGLLPPEAERDGFALGVCGGEGVATLLECCRSRQFGILGETPPERAEVLRASVADLWKACGPARTPRPLSPSARKRVHYETLRALGVELPMGNGAAHQDQLDAAAAAYVAYLWATGRARSEGNMAIPLTNS